MFSLTALDLRYAFRNRRKSAGSFLPTLDRLELSYRGRVLSVPYFLRRGSGPAILFIHGLGGAKENFYAAFQTTALDDCTLVAFDNPGTGLAEFDPAKFPDVNALGDIAHLVSEKLMPEHYFIGGASMGGLISLLKLRSHGAHGIDGFVNIEGNLLPEDCMFSRRTASYDPETFRTKVFSEMISELRNSAHTGDRIIAENMAMNTDARAYHIFSHQTVAESDSGRLLQEFLALKIPRLFLYGQENRSLSYLDRLRKSQVEVLEISRAAHFLFYENPIETFTAISDFVHRHRVSANRSPPSS
jgi:pimeloyl-ACP methyl ester carboxylesterase